MVWVGVPKGNSPGGLLDFCIGKIGSWDFEVRHKENSLGSGSEAQ